MTNGSNSPSSRFAIWLPSLQPAEAATLEQSCRDTVTNLNGQVVTILHNDPDRLLAVLRADEVDRVVYPYHGPLVRDALLAGIVHGVFFGLFRVTLCCAADRSFLAVPHAFAHLAQDVIVTHLQLFYSQSMLALGDVLPLGYRRTGNIVEIDPDQAGQVRKAFQDMTTDR
jgi:hypothetical protein